MANSSSLTELLNGGNSVLEFPPSQVIATTATEGSATLPADPVGFIVVHLNGGLFKLPYYDL